MKEVIDNFSTASGSYAQYRPTPPKELYEFVYKQLQNFDTAWDCGTGNGQIAVVLANKFDKVFATDISEAQLAIAPRKQNIIYRTERAEATTIESNTIDLITVAQAIHWFDFDAFYKEARRVAKHGAVIAVWTYYLLSVSPEVDELLLRLYFNITRPYWDKERQYVDDLYTTVPFPFEEIQAPAMVIRLDWTLEQIIGYLKTWSGLKHYMDKTGNDPLRDLLPEFQQHWGKEATRKVGFPLCMRIGRI